MASADFWTLNHTSLYGLLPLAVQTSPGKGSDNLHPIQPPHLHCKVRAVRSGSVLFLPDIWTSFCLANSSALQCLICDFCSSARDFASGFLQIPPRDGHPCLWLTLPAAIRVADFHRQVIAHAGRTKGTRSVPATAKMWRRRTAQRAFQRLAHARLPFFVALQPYGLKAEGGEAYTDLLCEVWAVFIYSYLFAI